MFRFDSRDEHENRAGISIKRDFYIVACNAAVDYALPTFWKEKTYGTVWRGVLICWSSRPQHSLGVRLTHAYILHRRLSPELVRRRDTHNRNALVKLRPQTHLKCRCKLRIQYMIAHSSGQSGWEVGVSGLGCSTRMSKGHSLSSLIGYMYGKDSFVQGTRDNKQAHIHCVQHLWSFHNGIMGFHDVKHEQVTT